MDAGGFGGGSLQRGREPGGGKKEDGVVGSMSIQIRVMLRPPFGNAASVSEPIEYHASWE